VQLAPHDRWPEAGFFDLKTLNTDPNFNFESSFLKNTCANSKLALRMFPFIYHNENSLLGLVQFLAMVEWEGTPVLAVPV
jgi:hypothetical protein